MSEAVEKKQIALSRVTELAQLIVEEEQRMNDLEMALDVQKKLVARLKQEDMPELMQELGLEMMRLSDGSVVKIAPGVATSITDATRRAAIEWLDAHGFGGLIKTQVAVAFDRDHRADAVQFYQQVRAQDVPAILQETVHPQTLKSFVREQIEKGACPPKDLFNIYQYKEAKIKLPKRKRLSNGHGCGPNDAADSESDTPWQTPNAQSSSTMSQ